MTADSLLAEASSLYASGQRSEGEARQSAYEAVLRNLDRIVEEFPGSDLSVQILLGESVGEIDLAEVQRTLAETVATGVSMEETALVPVVTDPEESLESVPSDPLPSSVPDSKIKANIPSSSEPVPVTGLAGAVQRCFATQAVGDIGDSFVQLRVVLDRQGRLEGTPVLTAPGGRAGPPERRLLRLGSAALEECQPYAEASEISSVELAFRTSGVSLVETTARTAEAPDGLKPKEEPRLAFAPAADPPEPVPSDRSGVPAAMSQPPAGPATPAVSEPSASLPTSPPLPVRPRVADPQSAEEALALDRAARREIQRRLVLLGFDTRGVDGVFGPGTRGAISNWQSIRGHSVTGFLDRNQLQDLQAQTEVAFEQWSREQASAQPRPIPTPSGEVRQGSGTARYFDDRGCLREADGRYVPNFKLTCR